MHCKGPLVARVKSVKLYEEIPLSQINIETSESNPDLYVHNKVVLNYVEYMV